MKPLQEYLADFLELIEAPAESRPDLQAAGNTLLAADPAEIDALCALYMADPSANAEAAFARLDTLAARCGVNEFAASFVFLCWNGQELKRRYDAEGIDPDIFRRTVTDLRYKLLECRDVKGVWGTFVRHWFAGFYAMTRFALGRLQYEFDPKGFRGETYEACGYTVKGGDLSLLIHIPSAGPLTKELREDSYRRAYEFYKDRFPGRPVVFSCSSWLLYPPHEQMIPGSNIVSFAHDFDPVSWQEYDTFHDGWRIYGADAELPPEQLPRRTTFQRAYADWLMQGNKAGSGYGVFLFDGTRFLRRDGAREHI